MSAKLRGPFVALVRWDEKWVVFGSGYKTRKAAEAALAVSVADGKWWGAVAAARDILDGKVQP